MNRTLVQAQKCSGANITAWQGRQAHLLANAEEDNNSLATHYHHENLFRPNTLALNSPDMQGHSPSHPPPDIAPRLPWGKCSAAGERVSGRCTPRDMATRDKQQHTPLPTARQACFTQARWMDTAAMTWQTADFPAQAVQLPGLAPTVRHYIHTNSQTHYPNHQQL